jgi:DNA polymerase
MKQYMVVDYETRSVANLRTKGKKIGVGAYEYAVHPSTKILCVAWKIGTKEELPTTKTKVWALHQEKDIPTEFLAALFDPEIRLVAHNAGFEQVITNHVLPYYYRHRFFSHKVAPTPISRWICTAALAATHALPRSLEDACMVLRLPIQKDPMGKLLIQRHCQPRKPTKNNPAIWNDDPEGLTRLAKYCATDVDAETGLFLALPPLTQSERKIWMLNQRINTRGVQVDQALVRSALKIIAVESCELSARALEITQGISPTQNAKILKVLRGMGCELPNMQAKTVDDAISSGLATGQARELLEIRQAISKTSTKKYLALDARSKSDGRLRDLQLYHGASTGREAGTGVQPHNFPRGTLEDVEGAIAAILEQDRAWLRALHGNVMAALSSVLRGCLRASPGHTLYCADFNAIEARVVFWLADHHRGLRLFEGGVDPYKEQAAIIFSKTVNNVTDDERFVGKQSILGCGFGMGDRKFRLQCKSFGRDISPDLAKLAIKAYRTKHAPVVQLWSNLEKAAIAATKNPGVSYRINHTRWFVKGKFLYCELPSGRSLAFFQPSVRYEPTPWGDKRPVLYHYGIEKHQWVNRGTYGGKLTENVVQGIARDVMKESELRVEEHGYIPLIDVHDEILSERKKGTGSLEEFETLMAQVPVWAKGLPVRVKGWCGERYKK